MHQVDAIAELLAAQGIAMWAAFFLVPVGRGIEEERITPEEYEMVFERLWHHADAPALRRENDRGPALPPLRDAARRQPAGRPESHGVSADGCRAARGHRAPLGVIDGRGIMFVGQNGEIYPAGFLPLCCGRFPQDSVVDVYQNHPTFRALRDLDHFKGKCGVCEYRQACGGSRARAYALTGDPLESDPDCAYQPQTTPHLPSPGTDRRLVGRGAGGEGG